MTNLERQRWLYGEFLVCEWCGRAMGGPSAGVTTFSICKTCGPVMVRAWTALGEGMQKKLIELGFADSEGGPV